MKIALAFSGGGVRATVFHLGVLARLARENLLDRVQIISSVSGGSLAAGLIFTTSGFQWPSSPEFLHHIVPQIHWLMTSRNLQRSYVLRSLMFPWRIARGRATVLGDSLERQWRIVGDLADLPVHPKWIINATCYQTGKNWRFQRDQMGDYQAKYVKDPDFRLSHALAASAAVPGLVGPLIIKTKRYQWSEMRDQQWHDIASNYNQLHLWDGGVYDNLGVEALFKPGQGLQNGTDFLIVCDASRPLSHNKRKTGFKPDYLEASMRLVDVATDQVRCLRSRMLVDYFKQNPGSGAYLRLGMQSRPDHTRSLVDGNSRLTPGEVQIAAGMETTLRRLTHREFSVLFRHGFEVADATLSTYCQEKLQQVPRNHVLFRAA